MTDPDGTLAAAAAESIPIRKMAVQCPHENCRVEVALRDLPHHLENCGDLCGKPPQQPHLKRSADKQTEKAAGRRLETAQAQESDGSAERTHHDCEHLERFEQMLTEFFPAFEDERGEDLVVTCPHPHSSTDQLNVPLHSFSAHLEECATTCNGYSKETGQCDHQLSLEEFVEEALLAPPNDQGQVQSPLLSNCRVTCPHENCGSVVSVDSLDKHMNDCNAACASASEPQREDGRCSHQDQLSLFLSSFRPPPNDQKHSKSSHSNDDSAGTSLGLKDQPPIFKPPEGVPPDELRKLRRQHLEQIKKLTPEQKRQRQILRNRRTAKLSRDRKVGRDVETARALDHLRALLLHERNENEKLRAQVAALEAEKRSRGRPDQAG